MYLIRVVYSEIFWVQCPQNTTFKLIFISVCAKNSANWFCTIWTCFAAYYIIYWYNCTNLDIALSQIMLRLFPTNIDNLFTILKKTFSFFSMVLRKLIVNGCFRNILINVWILFLMRIFFSGYKIKWISSSTVIVHGYFYMTALFQDSSWFCWCTILL